MLKGPMTSSSAFQPWLQRPNGTRPEATAEGSYLLTSYGYAFSGRQLGGERFNPHAGFFSNGQRFVLQAQTT